MTRMLKALAATGLLLALPSAPLHAQAAATAQIGGIVKDEGGGVLPGVDVTVTQTETGVTRSTVSDSAGAPTATWNCPFVITSRIRAFKVSISGSPMNRPGKASPLESDRCSGLFFPDIRIAHSGRPIGDETLDRVDPKEPTACKLVGTVRGTKLWLVTA